MVESYVTWIVTRLVGQNVVPTNCYIGSVEEFLEGWQIAFKSWRAGSPSIWPPLVVLIYGIGAPVVSDAFPSGNLRLVERSVVELVKTLDELVVECSIEGMTSSLVIVRHIVKGVLHVVVEGLMPINAAPKSH